jgi:hypothetical protein
MSNNSVILCPDCCRPLGVRRRNGNIAFRSLIEPSENGAAITLVCGVCGGRKEVDGVQPILLSA